MSAPPPNNNDPNSSDSALDRDSLDSIYARRHSSLLNRSRSYSRTFNTLNKPDLSRRRKQIVDIEKFTREADRRILFNQ